MEKVNIKVDKKYLKELEDFGVPYIIVKNSSVSEKDFDYVPSLGFYVAKNRKLLGKNWNESQNILHSNNEKMLSIPEFRKYLNFVKKNVPDIYEEITAAKGSWRGEWLDANFNFEGDDLFVKYHVFQDGKIVQKSSKIGKDTLMDKKIHGISLDGWLKNSTRQGLPTEDIESGDLYYWYPMESELYYVYPVKIENSVVARFETCEKVVGLDCDRGPSNGYDHLGVRAAKQRK